VGAVGRWFEYLNGQVGVREGEWVQVSNYNVCMTRRCLGGRSVLCAVEGWVGDCGGGVEISSSYWLDESRCVVLVGRLILDFVSICIRNVFFVREDEVTVMSGHGISLKCMLFYSRIYVGVEIPLDELPISLWGGSGVL